MRSLLLITALLLSTTTWGAANRVITVDQLQSSDGSKVWTPPSATSTLATLSLSETLTNKTMSGASNTFSNIPVGAIGNGSVLSGSNTGDVTIGTANGLSLVSQVLSLQLSSGSQTGALSSTDWTTFNGKLTSPLTTKGDLLGFDTANNRIPVGSNGQVLTADSTQALGVKWAAVPSTAPSLNGGSGAAQSVTAAGGVSLSSLSYQNFVWVAGNAGAVTVTATPSVTVGSADGQVLRIVGTSNTNTVTLQDQANLASSGLSLNGNWIGAKDSVLMLHWDATQSLWVEDARR